MSLSLDGNAIAARRWFLTDGGLETTLIFREGWDLPEFASFPLLDSSSGREALRQYYLPYLALADKHGTGFILSTPTWRASSKWARRLGFNSKELDTLNRKAVSLVRELSAQCSLRLQQLLIISGQIGPQDDAYQPETQPTVREAEDYHRDQIRSLVGADVDQIEALTLTNVEEAVAISRLSQQHDVPVVISFTVETDGKLPTGVTLEDAITQVDQATDQTPAHYMINCAHPDHFAAVVREPQGKNGGAWRERIGGLRCNASRMSHAELDCCQTLDAGDPDEYGQLHKRLTAQLPSLWVLGGCCGTDERHIGAMASTLSTATRGRYTV